MPSNADSFIGPSSMHSGGDNPLLMDGSVRPEVGARRGNWLLRK